MNEFICSFLFVFVYLILRHYKTFDDSRWSPYLKAFLVYYAYSVMSAGNLFAVGRNPNSYNYLSKGPLNSTVALSSLIWTVGALGF